MHKELLSCLRNVKTGGDNLINYVRRNLVLEYTSGNFKNTLRQTSHYVRIFGSECPLRRTINSIGSRNLRYKYTATLHQKLRQRMSFERKQKAGFVKGWFWRMFPCSGFSFRGNMRTYPRSGFVLGEPFWFRSGGTSECTLVLVFVPG